MATKLFVNNLDFEVTADQLRELFGEAGKVTNASIAYEKDNRRSKGFGFVEMSSDEEAKKAIELINGRDLNKRPIKVSEDRGKPGSALRMVAAAEEQRRESLPAVARTQLFRRKKKLDPFIEDPSRAIDYKDPALLNNFVSERGRIVSRKISGLTAYNQRRIAKAIKRSQNAGLMSFAVK